MKSLRDESGQAVALLASFMGLVMLGFLGLALDAGMLFRDRRDAQSAADAAAMAAAEESAAGNSTNEQAAANAVAKMHGFDPAASTNPATVSLSSPTVGNFTGSSYIQATVSKPVNTMVLGAFASKFGSMTVSAQSVAAIGQSSPTCVCLEAKTGTSLNLSNAAQVKAPQCGIIDDSSSSSAVVVSQGAGLSSKFLGTVSSSWDNSSNIWGGGTISSSTKIVQGIPSQCSPTMPAPPTYSNCANDPGGSSNSFTAGPSSASGTACYKSLTIGANGSADTLNPGTYVITSGELHFESGSNEKSNLGGNGVFFYLTGTASLVVDNGANLNLVAGGTTLSGGGTAPTVSSYNGILVYQDPSDTKPITIQGGSNTYWNGGIYAPSAAVTLSNGSSNSINASLVSQTLTMNGGATLNSTPVSNLGTYNLSVSKTVE